MISRTKVLWVGEPPDSQVSAEFVNRDLALECVGESEIFEQPLMQSRGIVYNFGSGTITRTRETFTATYKSAIDYGLCVYLLAENDTIQNYVTEFVGDEQRLRRRTLPMKPHEIPEIIARHQAGYACDQPLDIIEDKTTSPLTNEERILVKRAFWDCTSVSLKSLVGGMSARVFVAYATFRDSVAGPRPLPFFVKIDKAPKIALERERYSLYAGHFIPFNLRPNLEPDRCLESSSLGVLVGNFVERSESLWDVARRGQGQAAIHSLFDDTLSGWRIQAFCLGNVVDKPIAAGLLSANVFDYKRVKQSHLKFAAAFNVTAEPRELWETLIGLTGQKYRCAPMHGDLHGNNVRVRNGDAIVIDLASVTNGPLVADLAALETWCAFEVPPECLAVEPDDDRNWQDLVDELYEPKAFLSVPFPATETLPLEWLRTCVRQIRCMVGPIQLCETEYQSATAVYLLRRTMWEGIGPLDAFRRGYAYVLAAHLVKDLAHRQRPKCEQPS
jgi:hypothetical protein